jgi:xanthine dehydrogenase small subunit
MVDCHASQCGFCTPGFVMALFAFQQSGEAAEEATIHDALAGNLCRCTGYRPIVDAARRLGKPAEPRFTDPAELPPRESLTLAHGTQEFWAPTSLGALLRIVGDHPGIHVLAGGTDLGLWVTKEHRPLDRVVSVTRVPELKRITVDDRAVTLGAAVTYTDALWVIDQKWPSLAELVRRIGSRQIRNLGTIGGNIANASPIGDMPPALIALGATLLLRTAAGAREIPLEAFFIDYRRTVLQPGEIIEAVKIPLPRPGELFRTYKVAKRWDQDISAVCGAFRLTLAGDQIRDARVAYGGMAATPRRAPTCEATLIGAPWSAETIEAAAVALADDYAPLTDLRATADYRLKVASNLLLRLWLEASEPDLPLSVMTLPVRERA